MTTKYKWEGEQKPAQDNPWNNNDSLGTKIEKMFTRFVQRVFLWGVDFISDRLVDIFDNQMKILRPGMERATSDVFPQLKQIKGMPDFFYKTLEAIEKEQGETSAFTKLVVMYCSIRGIIFGGLQPYSDLANQWALNQLRTWLPDPLTTSQMKRIGLLDDKRYKDIMGGLGVPDGLQTMMLEITHNMPSVNEIIAGLWRGVYPKEEFVALLRRLGYDAADIELYTELSNNLPNVQDLIRMLVREAFNDDTSTRFSYDEDFPEEINPFFAKQGYNPDWAKRFWRAHWTLPSPSMAFDMFHRGLISRDELAALLKTSDYPKFWRDKMIDLSTNVFTRVDLRRLLQAGMIDEERTLKEYMAQGYNEERAKLLTEFAVKGISNDERDLTKTDILNLYEEGLTDRDTTAANLVKMGYDTQEAEDILKLSDVNIAKAMRTDLINYTKEKFIAKQIDEGQARGELAQIGLKQQSVDRYVMNWIRSQEIEAAIPSMADGKRWYLADLIDESKLRLIIQQHKHTTENEELYVREINLQKQEQSNATQ